MTDLDIMKRAKMYLDKMANGIDPLTDAAVSDTDCINQVRISRCLFYVSDVLRKLIENGGVIGKNAKVKKTSFSITQDELKNYIFVNGSISISEIAKRINSLVNLETMTRLRCSSITSFLIQCGFLEQIHLYNGKTINRSTEQGVSIGISLVERMGQNGPYQFVVYNADAQKFIIDNIEAVIEINNHGSETAELQGQSWTINYDEMLIDLFRKGVPVSEIAVTLKRTDTSIRARLKRLGLINNRSDAK